jgi:hypothetical protein
LLFFLIRYYNRYVKEKLVIAGGLMRAIKVLEM